MKRTLIGMLTVTSMVFTPALRSSDLTDSDAPSPTEEVQVSSEENQEDTGTPVSAGSDDQKRAANRQMWQNIGIAVGAIVIAVVALVLVSNHHGKKASH